MRLYVFGISGQIQIAAKDEEAAVAVAADYGQHLTASIGQAVDIEENETIVAAGIQVASKPKAILAVNPRAARRLGAQRDLFRDAILAQEEARPAKPTKATKSRKGPRAKGDTASASTPQ